MSGGQPSSGEERLPPPLADFVIYSKGNAIFMRYAPADIEDVGRRVEIALPEISPRDPSESPKSAFLRINGHLFQAAPQREDPRWEHACGYTQPAWEAGSEQGLQEDLASIIRVIADRHDLQAKDGLVLLWAYSRTPSDEPRLGLESYEIFATKSLADMSGSLRDELIAELKTLQTGLFVRNRPAGCQNKSDHSGSHTPLRFVVPLEPCSDPAAAAPEASKRYAEIAAAAQSGVKALH